MTLTKIQKKFISQWGEMGSRWGISKSIANVHALLYLSPDPLCAEDICELLSMARSNVSQALKELENWELVYKESRMAERKSFYRCQSDVWEMARCILKERKRREADGALRAVKECCKMAKSDGDSFALKRLSDMEEILQQSCDFADIGLKCKTSVLKKALGMGAKLFQLIGK